jgi:hypothetical protein
VTSNFFDLKSRPIFQRYEEGEYAETDEGYNKFESIAKKLFEQFKFLYEVYGKNPAAENQNDIHAYSFLLEAQKKGYTNLDGSPIRLTQQGKDPFGETSHAHYQRLFLTGAPFTSYQNDGFCSFLHNNGYEIFTGAFAPLTSFAETGPVVPYIFPTDHNYYTEITNLSYLNDARYDSTNKKPIYHPAHAEVFSEAYFKKIRLNTCLLKAVFQKTNNATQKETHAIRTLNFALALLNSMILIQSAYIDMFGFSITKKNMVAYIKKNWLYPKGLKTQGINKFHLHILNYLFSAGHAVSYLTCYCLYRHKFRDEPPDPGHTSCYPDKNIKNSFKDLLEEQIKVALTLWSKKLAEFKNKSKETEQILTNIQAAVELASLFGAGYETKPTLGKNFNFSIEKDFGKYCKGTERFGSLNFIVKYNPASPLWKFWYIYCGRYWANKNVNMQIFKGRGRYWKMYNKKHPRAWLYHTGYQYSTGFWKDCFQDFLKKQPHTHLKNELKNFLKIL